MNGIVATLIGSLAIFGGIAIIAIAATAIIDAINDYYNR